MMSSVRGVFGSQTRVKPSGFDSLPIESFRSTDEVKRVKEEKGFCTEVLRLCCFSGRATELSPLSTRKGSTLALSKEIEVASDRRE